MVRVAFFQRRKDGGLSVKSLDIQIFFVDLYQIAKTKEEIEWISEQIEGINEIISEEATEHLGD